MLSGPGRSAGVFTLLSTVVPIIIMEERITAWEVPVVV